MIAAGIGCRAGCDGQTIASLVREAENRAGHRADILAVPHFKRESSGLRDAATALDRPLMFIADWELAACQNRCETVSESALRATGFSSIAEAAALSAAGPDSVLILPRIAADGVTCALAGPP